MSAKTIDESRVTLTQVMGQELANVYGNVHGGNIMKLCDEAGAMAAIKHARKPCVTVAVDSMQFHSPVHVGNLLTLRAEVSWVGNTSIETEVLVTAEDVLTGKVTHTNTAYFVYVALNKLGRPTKVPEIITTTAVQKQRYVAAEERRAFRLKQRG